MSEIPEIMTDLIPLLRRIVLLIIAVYAGISGILYFFQERMLFHRPGITEGRLRSIRERFPEAEEVTVDTPDNYKLHGWLVHNGNREPSPLLIYFGGNAEEVSWMIEEKDNLPGWSILLINYRGYGLSEGSPGEEALLGDALLIYDTFSNREDILRDEIAVMGRSLGSAAAVYVSARRNLSATVLISSFGSIEDVARDNFPFIPVGHMLKHRFNVEPHAANADNPMLTMVASADRIIPMRHSNKLFQAWNGRKEFVVIQNAGHNDISATSLYWETIRDFLNDDRSIKNLKLVKRN